MLYHKSLSKKFVGSFIGVAGISTFIGFPGLAQANFNGSSNSSSQSILAQSTPETSTPSGGGMTPAPDTTNSSPSANPSGGTTDSTPSGGTTSAPSTTNSSPSLSALDKEFMTKAAQSDMTEIQTSKLALQKSQDKTVRAFAQHMIQAHTDSSQQLMQIAKAKGFTLPKDVGPDNRPLLTKLKQISGKNFNRAYMQGQVQAHTKTQAEYQKYLKQGQDPDLQGFASKISPVVAEHLEMAQKDVAKL